MSDFHPAPVTSGADARFWKLCGGFSQYRPFNLALVNDCVWVGSRQ
ncbi:hypothetical protein [Erythrobacter donghaensis]|nr:hypothetical protein [Erythrobacter donghaensis]